MFHSSQSPVPFGRKLTARGRSGGLPGGAAAARRRIVGRAAASLVEQLERRELLTVSFAFPQPYVTGDDPAVIVIADLNGDLKPDVVSLNTINNTASVLLNNGNGTLGTNVQYGAGSFPVDAVAADFNNDGFPDLAIANAGSGMVTFLFNNTNGTFGPTRTYFVGAQPRAVAAADFNGDGDLDLAVVVGSLDAVSILINNGAGVFSAAGTYAVGTGPVDLAAADFNGDGKMDLAVVNGGDNTVSILTGTGTGAFNTGTTLNVGVNPNSIVAADFNDDRRVDLAVAGGNSVVVLLSTGAGAFGAPVNYGVGPRSGSLATDDMDGDGTLDLIVGHDGGKFGRNVTVLVNNGGGSGNFSPALTMNVFGPAQGLAVADLDLDGRTDMVLPNPGPPTEPSYVSVYMSNRPAPAVSIEQADTQNDPTFNLPINFTVVFSDPVTGFTAADVVVGGTTGASIVEVTGSGTTYNVAVSGMTQSGVVFVRIPPNVARDIDNNGNLPSVSTDNTVTFQYLAPSVTINQASTQADPTNRPTVNFTVTFNKPVTGFDAAGVVLGGTAGATTAIVTGGGAAYNVAVSGMTQAGTVIATIPAGVATAADGYVNTPSTSTDNVVEFDNVPPSVTINQVVSQADPTDGSVILFTVVFDEPVTGFGPGSVVLSGTAIPTSVTVTGSDTTYEVVVTGMTRPGTVTATIAPGAAQDAAGNWNNASTSTDNTVFMRTHTPRADYVVGLAPEGAASADFNGDGRIDLVFTNAGSNTVSVLRNAGNGLFAPHADFITGPAPVAVVAADFNGDGRADLAVAAAGGDVVSVLLNRGDGVFLPRIDYAVGSLPTSVVAADFNGDGRADLAVTNRDGTSVSVLLNNGNGTFAPAVDYAVGIVPTAVAAADFNRDGLIDLAVATRDAFLGNGGFIVFLNNGGGTFVSSTIYAFSAYPESIISADFDGDGSPDIALCDSDTASLIVFLNDGAGFFVGRTDHITGANPVSVAALNFNGDGLPDLAVSSADGNTVDVFLNAGGGNFSTGMRFAVGADPRSLAPADFNGDGRADIAVAGKSANKATVLLNNRAGPTARITPAAGQANPTYLSPLNFTVVFNGPVTGFTNADVALSGSAGATTAVVTGGPTTYNVAVSGLQRNGAVTISIPANTVTDADGYGNAAATGPAATITYDNQAPAVTINRAPGQANPTNAATLNFTVLFSEPVFGFTGSDIVLGGTAGAAAAVVTSSNSMTYNVAVTGMSQAGTVTATIPAGAVTDAAGNASLASTSSDNTFQFNNVAPTVTINSLPERPDPTNQSPINFTVIFSKPVYGFTSAGIVLGGTAGATTATVTGGGNVYNVAVSGMIRPGTVIATIPAGVAGDIAGNANLASTSTDNTVTFDNQALTATVAPADAQANPANTSPIDFTVTFNKPVTGFGASGVVLGGTAGATAAVVTGGGTTYNIAVSGMQRPGTVVITIPAGRVVDAAGNFNSAAAGGATFDTAAPAVVVRRAPAQAASTSAATVNFTVVFSEPITGFGAGAVVLDGSAAATTATVTGGGTTYNVAVSGMQQSGTVIVTVPAGVVADLAGNPNSASTGADNAVTFDNVAPTAGLSAAAITAASKKVYKFAVTYADDVAVKTATIGNGDILVTGPRGYRTAAKWVKPSGPQANAGSVKATYSIAAPGGAWDRADNGLYTITLQYRQIGDLAGNAIAAPKAGLVLGTFRVGIGSIVAARTAALFSTTPVARSTNSPLAVVAWKPGDVLG